MKAVNQKVARRLGIRQFDAAEYLRDEASINAYLRAALADGDPGVLAAALGNIAKARGMTQLARKTGIAREALYRTLSANGNPELATLTKVLKGLGLRLSIAADDQRAVA
jgi:probable addiction module antidote protein